MGDSFKGAIRIILQPGDTSVPYSFAFSACSSQTANDGSIPFTTTIASMVVKAYDMAGADVTADIIVSESNSDLKEIILMKYPVTPGAGRYSLEMLATLSSGAVMEFDFTRLYALDIEAKR